MNMGQLQAILREEREADSEEARGHRVALRNVALCVLDLTTITRQRNGRGRAQTYNGDIVAIAGAARQLAEMVLGNAIDGTSDSDVSISEYEEWINAGERAAEVEEVQP
jgi:hypothetical protein